MKNLECMPTKSTLTSWGISLAVPSTGTLDVSNLLTIKLWDASNIATQTSQA